MDKLTSNLLVNDFVQYMNECAALAPAMSDIINPKSVSGRFAALRRFYERVDLDDYEPYPFGIDWLSVFTPIEEDAWLDIRSNSLPMWPQLPVGRYFLDFADPHKKIAIECDGREWHDSRRDAARDADLERDGWIVFRIPGHACQKTISRDWIELIHERQADLVEVPRAEVHEWLTTTSQGLIAAITSVFYERQSHEWFTDREAANAISRRTNHSCFEGRVPFVL